VRRLALSVGGDALGTDPRNVNVQDFSPFYGCVMREQPRLFCLDTVLIDVVLSVAALPPRAGDVRALEQLVTTGGGFNAMSAASRHHLRTDYAGRLGAGPFSDMASVSLTGENIGVPVEANADLDTGICVVLVEPDGERTFVTAPGAEGTLRFADLDALEVRDGDYVLVSGYNVMYPGSAEPVLAWLRELSSGVTVLFDPATRAEDIPATNVKAVLGVATWLSCNEREATQLSGSENVKEAAVALATRNEKMNVVVRLGPAGCLVALNHAEAFDVRGFATDVVDTNGAGDVHNGVFIAELASGHDAIAAARWANAAAAMAVSRFGPATCPTREEVAVFIESMDPQIQK
jgi:sugar/nucleoside kinase (ribokinase family)